MSRIDFGPSSADHGTELQVGGAQVNTLVFGVPGDGSAEGSDGAPHAAYLGGVVLHVMADGGPTLTSPETGDAGVGQVLWTNSTGTMPASVEAERATLGAQRLVAVARDADGVEQILGEDEGPCDGSLEAPCPTTLRHDIAVDVGLLDEGRYTVGVRAYDPFGNPSEEAFFHVGIAHHEPASPRRPAPRPGRSESVVARLDEHLGRVAARLRAAHVEDAPPASEVASVLDPASGAPRAAPLPDGAGQVGLARPGGNICGRGLDTGDVWVVGCSRATSLRRLSVVLERLGEP